jgi:hypothetical protein
MMTVGDAPSAVEFEQRRDSSFRGLTQRLRNLGYEVEIKKAAA